MNENTEGKLHNLKLDVPIAEKFVQPMADTFKVLGDPTRIRILALLAENESCVTNIAETLEMTQSQSRTSCAFCATQGWLNLPKPARKLFTVLTTTTF